MTDRGVWKGPPGKRNSTSKGTEGQNIAQVQRTHDTTHGDKKRNSRLRKVWTVFSVWLVESVVLQSIDHPNCIITS